jgi:hypothetical protein
MRRPWQQYRLQKVTNFFLGLILKNHLFTIGYKMLEIGAGGRARIALQALTRIIVAAARQRPPFLTE